MNTVLGNYKHTWHLVNYSVNPLSTLNKNVGYYKTEILTTVILTVSLPMAKKKTLTGFVGEQLLSHSNIDIIEHFQRVQTWLYCDIGEILRKW